MEPLLKRLLLTLLLALAVALAGCADQAADDADSDAGADEDADAATKAQAREMLLAAGQDFPDRFSFELTGANARGDELLGVRGALDNATQQTYIEFDADPAFLQASGADENPAAAFFGSSFTMYVSQAGTLYLTDGAAIVLPPGQQGGFAPSPRGTPAAAFADPEALFQNLAQAGVNVTRVEATTHDGQSALEIGFTFDGEEQSGSGTAVVLQEPVRLAKLDVQTNATTADEPSRFSATFHYDDADQIAPSQSVQRALGLAYASDAPVFGAPPRDDNGTATLTWTFLREGGVPAADAELVAYDAPHEGDGLVPPESAVLWRMGLDAGAASHDGVNATFTDADADGLVSAGDTLRVTLAKDVQAPGLVLHDEQTGVHLFELRALIAALASGSFGSG